MTDYRTWLRQQIGRNDNIGNLARIAFMDKEWNGTQKDIMDRVSDRSAVDASIIEFRNAKGDCKRRTARGPYTLKFGTYTGVFKTKEDITKLYRGLKEQYYGLGYLECSLKDQIFALLINHPTDVVTGFESIKVDTHPIDKTICYMIDDCPISFNTCIGALGNDGKNVSTMYRKFFATARCEVHDQTSAVDKTCDEHIDHVTFFSHLLYDWLDTSGYKISNISCTGSSYQLRFSDRTIADSWKRYHYENARLRALDHKLNSKRKPGMLDWTPLIGGKPP